jgi:preprotein translocase subunit SecG
METLQTVLLVLQVLAAVSLIGLILIQHGKGADAGAAFGSGASSTVFGSQGSGNFMTKTTAVLAFLFLANSLALAYISNQRIRTVNASLMDDPAAIVQPLMEEPSSVITEIPAATQSDIPTIPD